MSKKISHYEVQYLEPGNCFQDAYENCIKKDKHARYISRTEVINYLPGKDTDLLEFIYCTFDLTGMLEVKQEKGVYRGSCFVQKVERITGRSCPCTACCEKRADSWVRITVATSLRMIPLASDAQLCDVWLFYDSAGSDDGVKKLQGVMSHSRDHQGGWCALICVTHDFDLLNRLEKTLETYWKLGHSLKERYQHTEHNFVVVVSHPHGGPKCVSIGEGRFKQLAREVRDDQDWCYYSYNAATCEGSSGGPVYILGKWNDGFGYWFGHSHNHSGIDSNGYSMSTIGVDSTFRQISEQSA